MPDDPDALTTRLQAAQDDAPPQALLAAARAAFSWRTLDVDLSRPSYDSLLDEAMTPVRGASEARLLRFDSQGLTLDIEVAVEGEHRTLVGQLFPAAPAEVTVRHGGAVEIVVPADEDGRFTVADVRSGPLSLRCTRTDGTEPLHTDWVLI